MKRTYSLNEYSTLCTATKNLNNLKKKTFHEFQKSLKNKTFTGFNTPDKRRIVKTIGQVNSFIKPNTPMTSIYYRKHLQLFFVLPNMTKRGFLVSCNQLLFFTKKIKSHSLCFCHRLMVTDKIQIHYCKYYLLYEWPFLLGKNP